jgi:hypothetical protein
MPNQTWKKVENRIAKAFDTRRTGPTGRDTFDFMSKTYRVGGEVKYRKKLRGLVVDAMKQAEDHYEELDPEDKWAIPIVVLVEKGMRTENALCVLRLEDFKFLVGT